MAPKMPTAVELEQVFGPGGPAETTRSGLRQLIDAERKGRREREGQLSEACSVQVRVNAEFTEQHPTTLVTDWIAFGEMQFVKEPYFTTGSRRLAQEGEDTLAADGSNFDPLQHFTVPGAAMVVAWKTNERGNYVGAKLLLFALASVPVGYKVLIYGVFVGPAVRMG
ncbi:MAG: hypothetical protein JW990_12015 [Thermoleophilia bacterium]|nr:hypothetical protein [Thermoleophilia bacterium]